MGRKLQDSSKNAFILYKPKFWTNVCGWLSLLFFPSVKPLQNINDTLKNIFI
jgi:hypothetical protein